MTTPSDDSSSAPLALKGILSDKKKKKSGVKKSVTWASEDKLQEIRFFENDETERKDMTPKRRSRKSHDNPDINLKNIKTRRPGSSSASRRGRGRPKRH